MTIYFTSERYSVVENMGSVKVYVKRDGPLPKASVEYFTEEGTAKKGEDYEAVQGELTFEKDQDEAFIEIPIKDNDRHEENKEFKVRLKSPKLAEGAEGEVVLGDRPECTIVIIDDDPVQKIKFENEVATAQEKDDKFEFEVKVMRVGGSAGTVTFNYHLEGMGAVAGFDYEDAKDKVEMKPSMAEVKIPVVILPSSRINKAAVNLVLESVEGAAFDDSTDGGEDSCICHINIMPRGNRARTSLVNRMKSRVASANAQVGRSNWKQQFIDAVCKVVDDDDDEEDADEPAEKDPPSPADWFFHILGMPWKLLFAFIPPTDFCGGWACFYGALAMIAVVTAIVGDMAGLVGSCLGIHPEITAITFVALGTSLPDTFASMAAAQMDPYADASIGNVTGSNSVNVFLGIGISWLMAALWWSFTTFDESTGFPTSTDHFSYFGNLQGGRAVDYTNNQDEWTMQDHYWNAIPNYPCSVVENIGKAIGNKDGGMTGNKLIFVTPAGTMGYNLMTFSINAFAAIWHLFARRKKFGGELGGPRKAQIFSACFLGFQWFLYILVSCIIVLLKDMDQQDELDKNGYKGCGPDALSKFAQAAGLGNR